jgi:hypothetical protein
VRKTRQETTGLFRYMMSAEIADIDQAAQVAKESILSALP